MEAFNKLTLRPVVPSDIHFLFDLVNEPSVRANSFNSRVISWEEHRQWFDEKLNDDCRMYIACVGDSAPVGQIRVDKQEDYGIITLSVSHNFRSRGLGTQMLKQVIVLYNEGILGVDILIGRVKKENVASSKIFLYAGFKEFILPPYNEYRYNN